MVQLRSFASPFGFAVLVRLLLCGRAEVVPQQDLADLTADDLQLLLSGTGGAITLDRCRKVAEFRDMRGPEVKASDPERLAAFSGLMWDALALMQPRELLKLVEFATAHRTIVKTLIINLVRDSRWCTYCHCLAWAVWPILGMVYANRGAWSCRHKVSCAFVV